MVVSHVVVAAAVMAVVVRATAVSAAAAVTEPPDENTIARRPSNDVDIPNEDDPNDRLAGHEVGSDAELRRRVDALNAWLAPVLPKSNAIKAAVVGGALRLGAVATRDVAVGDVYNSVPLTHIMSLWSAEHGHGVDARLKRIIPRLDEATDAVTPDSAGGGSGLSYADPIDVLALHLMVEARRGADSPFHPYISLLPSRNHYSSVLPSRCHGDDAPLLTGSELKHDLAYVSGLKRRRRMRLERAIMNMVQKTASKTLADVTMEMGIAKFEGELLTEAAYKVSIPVEDYGWALDVVESRAIWWVDSNGRQQPHLVPLLDMINHAEGVGSSADRGAARFTTTTTATTVTLLRAGTDSDASDSDRKLVNDMILARPHQTKLDASGTFADTAAARPYAEGEQVFENYAQPNHQFFRYHGFSVVNNTQDCLLFNLRVAPLNQIATPEQLRREKLIEILLRNRYPRYCLTALDVDWKTLQPVRSAYHQQNGNRNAHRLGDALRFYDIRFADEALLGEYERYVLPADGRSVGGRSVGARGRAPPLPAVRKAHRARLLIDDLEQRMKAYQTPTVADDEKLLAEDSSVRDHPYRRAAVQYRLTEKHQIALLIDALDAFATRVEQHVAAKQQAKSEL